MRTFSRLTAMSRERVLEEDPGRPGRPPSVACGEDSGEGGGAELPSQATPGPERWWLVVKLGTDSHPPGRLRGTQLSVEDRTGGYPCCVVTQTTRVAASSLLSPEAERAGIFQMCH